MAAPSLRDYYVPINRLGAMNIIASRAARAVALNALLLLFVPACLDAGQRGALTASRNLADLVGLSSPVGLEQGRFQLSIDAAGNAYATNGRNNAGLLNGVAARATAKGIRLEPRSAALVAAPPQGPLALSDLLTLIRQLASVNSP